MGFGDIGAGAGSALGGVYGLATMGSGGKRQYKQGIQEWDELEGFLPEYDMASVPAPMLRHLGDYDPQLYDATTPESVALAQDSPEARRQQELSVGRLGMYRDEGLPMLDRVRAMEAQRGLQRAAGNQFASGRRELAQRGRLSGGLGASLAASRGQAAADMGRDMGEDLIRAQIENQYRATMAADQAASRLRGQDIDLSAGRANATNRFNEMVSQMHNQAAQANQQQLAQAQQYNVGNQQRIGEQNQINQYNARLGDIDRQNQLRGQSYDDRFRQVQGKTGALTGYGDARYGEQASRLNNAQQIGRGFGQAGGGALDLAFAGGG